MTGVPEGTWGRTKHDREHVHWFEHGRRKCPSKGHKHGWLFYPIRDWNPDHPDTCPECKRMLEDERKVQEAAGEHKKRAEA